MLYRRNWLFRGKDKRIMKISKFFSKKKYFFSLVLTLRWLTDLLSKDKIFPDRQTLISSLLLLGKGLKGTVVKLTLSSNSGLDEIMPTVLLIIYQGNH